MLTRPLETTFWIGALAARGRVVDLEVDRDMAELAAQMLRRWRPRARA